MKVAWVTPFTRACGIATYSNGLWPSVEKCLRLDGTNGEPNGEIVSLDEFQNTLKLRDRLRLISPDIIHFQHEYGLFGGKNPPFYWFPKLKATLREALPNARQVATAHTVLSPSYTFPTQSPAWQVPLRLLANALLLPTLRQAWGPGTWGNLDSVILHSASQLSPVAQTGTNCVEIPHYVPNLRTVPPKPREKIFTIVVFGFLTPEKGQDIAIRAMAKLPKHIQLVIAGGVRRNQDSEFAESCRRLIEGLHLADRIRITGYVPQGEMDRVFASADLVLAPFRETSGSGSVVQAIGRGLPVLTSDLPINREIAERTQNAVGFFKTEDAGDLARAIEELEADEKARERLRQGAITYAKEFSAENIAKRHLEFYKKVLANN